MISNRSGLVAVVGLVLVLATGCGSGSGYDVTESSDPALQTIELDIFSGRPNPSWQLDVDARKQLVSLLNTLTPAQTSAPEVPGLGYRGFTFGMGGPARAYGGFVATPLRVLADPDRTVERFLLDQLPAEFSDVKEVVQTELGP